MVGTDGDIHTGKLMAVGAGVAVGDLKTGKDGGGVGEAVVGAVGARVVVTIAAMVGICEGMAVVGS